MSLLAIENVFDVPLPIVAAFTGILGIIGSFLNVVIHRIPLEQSIVFEFCLPVVSHAFARLRQYSDSELLNPAGPLSLVPQSHFDPLSNRRSFDRAALRCCRLA